MTGEDREDIKRHFSVVSEGLRSEIRLLAEAVGGNNDRLDRFEGRLDRTEGRLDRIEGRLDRIEGRLDRIETRIVEEFGEIKAMIRLSFGELDRRIRSLEGDVNSLRERLEKLEARSQTQ
jgi:chromosome segregation ATPase